ncbi:hypothetical protein LZ31DRAFT_482553, partial [Colletotrichum somersetense]
VYNHFIPTYKVFIVAIILFSSLTINLVALLVLLALPKVLAVFSILETVINFSNILFLSIIGISVF